MPATEETYRSQPTLHIVFAISSIAMMLSIVWMIMADHLRPWKQVQREFQQVERGKLEAAEQEKLEEQKAKYQAQIDEIDAKIEAAEASADEQRRRDPRGRQRAQDSSAASSSGSTPSKRFMKAELDSQRSLYDGMIDRGEEREARALPQHASSPRPSRSSTRSRMELEEADRSSRQGQEPRRKSCSGTSTTLKKEQEQLTREADRVQR